MNEPGTPEDLSREAWDRLAILLIAEPRQGFERWFREIAGRELERTNALLAATETEGDDGS